ncbi:MAG: DUF2062 domain-containing protein [Acidobacteria bacterium]|nr:DUF2062 domain-containing protein [Acidobacteriota bacterium]
MREKLAHFIRRLLSLDDTPEHIAKAFALGVFLAFSPLVGLHLFLGVTLPFFLGLNRIAFLLGVFINNPWTLIPIYAAGTYLGGLVMGFPPRPTLPDFEWHLIWNSDFWTQLAGHWRVLKPMFVGSFILSALLSAFSYFAALYLIRQRRARRENY